MSKEATTSKKGQNKSVENEKKVKIAKTQSAAKVKQNKRAPKSKEDSAKLKEDTEVAIFDEGSDVMEMEVTQEDEREFLNQRGSEDEDYEDGEISFAQDDVEIDSDMQRSDSEAEMQLETETVVEPSDWIKEGPCTSSTALKSSKNNNASEKEDLVTNSRKRAKLVADKGIQETMKKIPLGNKGGSVQMDEQEKQSMMKFTLFLQEQGFLTRSTSLGDGASDTAATHNQSGKTATTNGDEVQRSQNKRKDNGKKCSNEKEGNLVANDLADGQETTLVVAAPTAPSEATIYDPVVILELSSEGEQGKNKRSSSSSEDEINLSPNNNDKSTKPDFYNTESENLQLRSAEFAKDRNEQILYQQFLDCRLKEQRREVAEKERSKDKAKPATAEDRS